MFRRDPDSLDYVTVPRKEERKEIVKKEHLLGHFQIETTYERLKENYYWKKMKDDVEFVVKTCLPCHRNEKYKTSEHPARSLPINELFERVGLDLVLGLPETKDDFSGVMTMIESL